MTLKALIFDVDGTFAETERFGHRMAFNDAFYDLGLDWYWDESLYGDLLAVGGGRERLEAYIRYYRNESTRGRAELIGDIHETKARYFKQRVGMGDVKIRPGIARILSQESWEAGLKLAVATNCSITSLTALTKQFFQRPPEEVFDVVVCGRDLKNKKPAPDAYEIALQRLGLEAEECLAFEDSYVGLKAARTVGVPTVVTVSDYTSGEDFSGAKLVLDNLGEAEKPCELQDGDWEATLPPEGFVTVPWLQALHAQHLG
ncbi:MAG: HAD-IA family hydrolase [Gammaproteobacteria bacterium]|nr:HAD-IA family hydrolase [Gammaproteobacteria bacterium]